MNPTMIPTFYETKRSITKTFHEAKKERRRRNLTNALPTTMMKEEDEEEEKSLTGKIPSSAFPLSLSLHDKTTIDNDTAPSV
jgi:hypothetical protein